LSAVFIASFDCEGKWGLADQPEGSLVLFKNPLLTDAYSRILELLDRYRIQATFAFVAAYCMDRQAFEDHRAWFEDDDAFQENWLSLFKSEIARDRIDGWFNPKPLELVKARGCHEIASHGFTHRPLSEDVTPETAFYKEMSLGKQFFAEKGCDIKTFIYPRNQIGHVQRLSDFGILGYRDARRRPSSKMLERVLSLTHEFFGSPANTHSDLKEPLPIPSGYFLNHRAGLRAVIPPSTTFHRWRSIVDDAIMNDRVVHLWSHPHNFVTGRLMYDSFGQILSYVAEKADQGLIKIQTQWQYTAERLSNSF
jgi:hypothetical protein